MATWQHLRSSTANKRPTTSLADGRIAINTNTASPGLFFKDSAGTGIVKVGPVHVGTTAPNSVPASGGSSGNYLGEQWLDTNVSPAQMKVWNGSTWVGIVADELPVSKLQDGAPRQLIQTDAAGTGVEWTSNVDVPGTLDVTSTATFDSIAQYPLGSAAAPTITFTGDNNTGIYSPGADQVAISTGGSGKLFVNNAGEVDVSSANARLYITATGSNTAIATLRNASYYYNINLDGSNGGLTFYNGTERLRITAAGLVGVGVSGPSSLLHVESSFSGTLAKIKNNAGSTSADTALEIESSTTAAKTFLVKNAGTERFYVKGDGTSYFNGSVGIGTTTVDDILHLKKAGDLYLRVENSSTNAIAYFGQNSSGTYIGNGATGSDIRFLPVGTERCRLTTSGQLLVGTSSALTNVRHLASSYTPQYQFSGTNQTNTMFSLTRTDGVFGPIQFFNTGSSGNVPSSGTSLGVISFNGYDGTNYIQAASIEVTADAATGSGDMPGRLVFSTTADGASSPTERMRIGSNGNIGIGNINSSTIRLYVKAANDSNSDYGFYVENGSGTQATFSVRNDGVFCTGTAASSPYNNTTASAANLFVTAGGVLQRSTSSIKYKKDVRDAVHGLSELLSLRPVTYKGKAETDQGKTFGGLIAEEVHDAGLSEFVQYAENGSPDALAYGNMVSLCIKAIQEQQAMIVELQAKVAALESA